MPIIDSELLTYKSTGVTDVAATNGGRMSANRSVSGVKNNLFPDIGRAERTAGGTVVRKEFYKIANDSDLSALNARLWQDRPTAGDEYAWWVLATQRNFQSELSGAEEKHGAANLSTNAVAASSTIVVTVENAALTGMFRNGGAIVISDKVSATSTTGNEEFHVISGAPVVVGLQVTITTTSVLANSYTVAAGTRVSTVYENAEIKCSVSNWVETGAGTFDETTYPVLCDNIGTIEQTWTLTFTDPTHFTVSGDTVGAVGTGATGADFAPSNPAFTKPYFTLYFAGFGGTWAGGNTIVFQTHPAAIGYFIYRQTPAGAGVIASSSQTMAFDCESAA